MKAHYCKSNDKASQTKAEKCHHTQLLRKADWGQRPLLYHSDHNSASLAEKKEKKEEKNKKYKPTNKQAKCFKVLDLNAKNWLSIYGREHIGILTLTFKENLTCMKEAQRRWNSFSRQVNKHGKFQLLVKVAEPQKRGAVHYHCLVKTSGKIRKGLNWEIYDQMGKTNSRKEKRDLGKKLTSNTYLKEMWSWIRATCQKTGFGRSELMPLRKPNHIKNYIGKYLEKDMRENALKQDGKNGNKRLITYGKKAPKVANQQFSWRFGKASLFRYNLKKFCHVRGIKDHEELKEIYGKSWSHHLYKDIMYDRAYVRYSQSYHENVFDPEKSHKKVYPWKGQIKSGAFTHETIEGITREYFAHADKQKGRGTSLNTEYKALEKWRAAEKAKKLHELISP